MVSPGSHLAVHVAVLSLSAVLCLGLAGWVRSSEASAGQKWFVVLLVADAVWASTAALGLLVPPGTRASLVVLRGAAQVTIPLVWVRFTAAHTGREFSLSDPRFGGLTAAWLVSLVSLVTNGLHGLYWSSVTLRTDPFAYLQLVPGPLLWGAEAYIFCATAVGIHYLAERFTRSRHRSRTAVYVLFLGAILASVPAVVTVLGAGPLPGYDYSAFGIGVFAAMTTVAVYRLGALDIEPVARDVLFDAFDDAVVVLDDRGRLADFNVAAAALWPALDEGDPIGEPLGRAVPELAAELPALTRTTDPVTEEVHLDVAGGRRHFSLRVAPISSDDVRMGHTLVLREVTALVTSRRELERKNRQLDEFTSAVAHDLKNPLNVADGYTRLAADSLRELADAADEGDEEYGDAAGAGRASLADPEVLDHLERASGAHERMLQIIDDLQTLAHEGKSVETTAPVDLRSVATDAWSNLDTSQATLRVTADATVRADRGRLLSVLENLYRNSVRHGGEAVVVEVGAGAGSFFVQDDGPGVPAADRETVFEYGYSTHDAGTGLGLPIVRTMAESHGWSVRLDADYEEGARFVFEGVAVEHGRDTEDAGTDADRDGPDRSGESASSVGTTRQSG